MKHYISRGVTFNLSSIGVNFINNYLDTFKGIEKSNEVIADTKINTFEKAENIAELVLMYNVDHKVNYSEKDWSFILNSIQMELYKLISKKELVLEDRVV